MLLLLLLQGTTSLRCLYPGKEHGHTIKTWKDGQASPAPATRQKPRSVGLITAVAACTRDGVSRGAAPDLLFMFSLSQNEYPLLLLQSVHKHTNINTNIPWSGLAVTTHSGNKG